MKKIYALLAMGLMFAAPSASAMDSQTLLAHPEQYRVIYADDDEVVYADMGTFSGQQTMDYPSSIENMSFKMYVESYRQKLSLFDFEPERMVAHVAEYDANLHANKRDNQYGLDKKLVAVFDAKGEALDLTKMDSEHDWDKDGLEANAKDLYVNLFRIEKARLVAKPAEPDVEKK